MSDTFAFRTVPIPLYRRVNLRVLKAVVACAVVVFAVGSFARWTMRSEQASFAEAARHAAATQVTPVHEPPLVGIPASGVTSVSPFDHAAQDVARHTLTRARHIIEAGATPVDAGPGQLATFSTRATFTDGPSLAPTIVSVEGTNTAWGAAVMSESGSCFAVRLDEHGVARFGTLSSSCTGAAALQVTATSW